MYVVGPYADCCDVCPDGQPVEPVAVWANAAGTGVVADYLCPAGHPWMTGWAWWSGDRHATDGQEAA